MKTITYNPETHVLVLREPSEEMLQAALRVNMRHVIDCINDPTKSKDIGSEETCKQTYRSRYASMIAAAPQPEQVESEPVPDFRGYAALGTGQYLLNACPATEVLPAELVISIATEEEKAGRVIGDLKVVEPGTEIDPSSMAVRLAFFSVSGLDALEQQLRILREESFPNTTPQPDRVAELEQLRQQVADLEKERDELIEVKAAENASWNAGFNVQVDQLKKLTAERDAALNEARDFESDVDTVTQHNVELQLETIALKSALNVARDALIDCEGALDECRDYPITYDTILEALAKINEVLK